MKVREVLGGVDKYEKERLDVHNKQFLGTNYLDRRKSCCVYCFLRLAKVVCQPDLQMSTWFSRCVFDGWEKREWVDVFFG